MLLFYIDECGDHSMNTVTIDGKKVLKPGVSPFFVLSAVGIPDSSRRPLAEAIFDLKTRHFGQVASEGVWADTEIKGRHLQRASRSVATGNVLAKPAGFSKLTTEADVGSLVRDLGLLFDQYRPLTFTIAIDKVRLMNLKRPMPPLGAAYAYLQQRVALGLERLHAGQSAILIADQQTEHEKFFRSGQMNIARDKLSSNLPRTPNFKLVVDKPLWVDTELSSWDRELIQLADIVAYSTYECMLGGKSPDRPCYLWSNIRSSLALHWRTGRVASGGFAIYPRTDEYPEI